MTDDRFPLCLPLILDQEGGNDDDPDDPGGRTSRGIIQREYNAYRHTKGEPAQDVWSASDAEVADIYQHQYWLPLCPRMPSGVDLLYFDVAVNAGPHQAALFLQRALGVHDDGHVGMVTMGALAKTAPIKVISCMSDQRRRFYRRLKTFWKYGKGWLRRVNEIEQAALRMAVIS